MKNLLITTSIFLLSHSVFSQSNPLDKKLEKAAELMVKGKSEEADEYMIKLLEKNPDYGKGWDYLRRMRFQEYNNSKGLDGIFNNITITTKDKDGKEIPSEDDSLKKSMMGLLGKLKPSEVAFDKYIYTMRKATLTAPDAYRCSGELRAMKVDAKYDTAVSRKALKYFNDAEEEFGRKNYADAAKHYKRALDEQPDFFKATLYMGDCYYFLGNYTEAIQVFKQCVDKFPENLEARKYLIDAYGKEGIFDKAINEAITAMTVYPDYSIEFAKLEDALYLSDKNNTIKWTPRAVFPNTIVKDSSESSLNKYDPKEKEKEIKPWIYYNSALERVEKYCNPKGLIVKPNSLTQSKYLEVYSWEEMLKYSDDPLLEEARRMQRDGYLDCYVLVTCFHYDFYDQYKDFVKYNKDRVIAYYNKYIVARD